MVNVDVNLFDSLVQAASAVTDRVTRLFALSPLCGA